LKFRFFYLKNSFPRVKPIRETRFSTKPVPSRDTVFLNMIFQIGVVKKFCELNENNFTTRFEPETIKGCGLAGGRPSYLHPWKYDQFLAILTKEERGVGGGG
jgi:hypothetical protein